MPEGYCTTGKGSRRGGKRKSRSKIRNAIRNSIKKKRTPECGTLSTTAPRAASTHSNPPPSASISVRSMTTYGVTIRHTGGTHEPAPNSRPWSLGPRTCGVELDNWSLLVGSIWAISSSHKARCWGTKTPQFRSDYSINCID